MLIFNIGTNLYFFIVRIASLWNPKAKLFINGRKDAKDKLKRFKKNHHDLFWFHCASLGEFEQARPLIEKLKSVNQSCQVVITFFSPSGYEIRKNYKLADLILYLPKDSKANANLLLDSLRPSKIFFIKYEFWANYLLEANKRKIPTYLVSGVFREKQIFFIWYGAFMRSILNSFTAIFLQDNNSKILLASIGVRAFVSGDTRYDRVMQNALGVKIFPEISKFVRDEKCIVIGSCWAEDEEIIIPALNKTKNVKIIIAPHELSQNHFKSIETAFDKNVIRYSELKSNTNIENFDVLLIDNIGMLMHLYQFASVAYIGGAFVKGLHNILEPASFGVPVVFGSNYSKFPEAYQFIEAKIGFSISNAKEFEYLFKQLIDTSYSDKVLRFMKSQEGATQKVIDKIQA